ncbi:ATP synthase subunit beta, mitochondrial [Plakobranchus ocellatus]|uniref:ATP synthase subunit beta, mitochondrial n=1 Tax=Plakobranchus ocellatus TaxID=259542 RepID=A0AAV3XY41_9GAST|nr:ATP synthase subunit beta, mitochondrial [Plakobranchus ocellatus]
MKVDGSPNTQHNLKNIFEKFEFTNCQRTVIVGPDTADKTSLVFQAAVTAASAGLNVTHICTHPLKRLPAPVHGMPSPDPNKMKNVEFLYFEESSELISWFASLHTMSRLPNLIIVEDVLSYASQLNDTQLEKSLARICATISDAAMWLACKSAASPGCDVILTAPARVLSLSHAVRQFGFKISEYCGRSKVDGNSELSFREGKNSITVRFQRHNDVLMLTDVTASTSAEQSVSKTENYFLKLKFVPT